METLEDGRRRVPVRIRRRVRTVKILQSVPYGLAKVQVLKESGGQDPLARERYEKIFGYAVRILGKHAEAFESSLPSRGSWSFRLRNLFAMFLQWVRVDAEICQQLLEEDNLGVRAQFLSAILRSSLKSKEKRTPPPARPMSCAVSQRSACLRPAARAASAKWREQSAGPRCGYGRSNQWNPVSTADGPEGLENTVKSGDHPASGAARTSKRPDSSMC